MRKEDALQKPVWIMNSSIEAPISADTAAIFKYQSRNFIWNYDFDGRANGGGGEEGGSSRTPKNRQRCGHLSIYWHGSPGLTRSVKSI